MNCNVCTSRNQRNIPAKQKNTRTRNVYLIDEVKMIKKKHFKITLFDWYESGTIASFQKYVFTWVQMTRASIDNYILIPSWSLYFLLLLPNTLHLQQVNMFDNIYRFYKLVLHRWENSWSVVTYHQHLMYLSCLFVMNRAGRW